MTRSVDAAPLELPCGAERADGVGRLLRRVLVQEEQTTLAAELALVRDYLAMEQVRFGERLRFELSCPKDLAAAVLPSLVLQPLVENAVYHGIAQLPAGGTILVRVGCEDSRLEVTVINPMPDRASHNDGHRMALANIEQRLQALYGSEGELQSTVDSGCYTVRLSYPRESGQ